MARVVCVSNRVSLPDPVTGEIKAGGLAVGVRAALEGMGGGLWFGWDGRRVADDAARDAEAPFETDSKGIHFVTMPLTEKEYDEFYKGMANEGLWPMMHELDRHIGEQGASYQGYREVNDMFARRLKEHLQPDDVIWVHDYHLIPLGESLRKLGVNNRILYFNHIPIPSASSLTRPGVSSAMSDDYAELARSLFAYDQVGFQSFRDLRNFKGYIGATDADPARFETAPLSWQGRQTQFGVFPISIETDDLQKIAAQTVTPPKRDDVKLIIGAERLDYTKGLPLRVKAVSDFLQNYPQYGEHVKYVQITPLSRDDIDAYRGTIDKVRTAIAAIKERFGEDSVEYSEQSMPREKLVARFRQAAVGLVTPLMDGQNLVAKEFLAAQDAADPGVLVLSKFAGAAEELGEAGALLVDPTDAADIGRKIHQALTMSQAQRVAAHARLIETLEKNDIKNWAACFLKPVPPAL